MVVDCTCKPANCPKLIPQSAASRRIWLGNSLGSCCLTKSVQTCTRPAGQLIKPALIKVVAGSDIEHRDGNWCPFQIIERSL